MADTILEVKDLVKYFKSPRGTVHAVDGVSFSIERGRYRAEITIKNNGMYYRANELTNDMYASIDSGVAAIERQIFG